MVEQPVMVEVGGSKIALTSSSAANSPFPLQERSSEYRRYPPPLARYEEIVASPTLFRETLEKVHAAMGTKFMIPTVGGRDLDLHRLFVEVTSRGGIAKILQERKWKDIIGAFTFPSSATNASFILRKYYFSLLHHYEQIYFLKADGWSPEITDALQNSSSKVTPLLSGHTEPKRSSPISQAATLQLQRQLSLLPTTCGRQAATVQESAKFLPEANPAASTGSEVFGVIDGKFESGYLITVKIGSEEFKGVLYQSPLNPSHQVTQLQSNQQCESISVRKTKRPAVALGVVRRKRRKKSEIKKRDPAHPKPNRSGYNFFFAEEHARLKPLYPGKDRDISRMIGESWNKLKEPEKSIYQEKAMRDKERYRIEMQGYRERLRTGQINSSALPVHQQSICPHLLAAMDVDKKLETKDANLSHSRDNDDNINIELSIGQTITDGSAMQQHTLDTHGNETRPIQGDKRNLEEHQIIEGDGEVEMSCGQDIEQGYIPVLALSNEEIFEVQKRADMYGNENKEYSGDTAVENDKKGLPTDEGIPILFKGKISAPDEGMEALPNNAQ